MSHIIDADKLKQDLTAMRDTMGYDAISLDGIIKGLEDQQEIDPVHAAGGCYCRECVCFKNVGRETVCYRFSFGIPEEEDAFCSHGRRKDSDMSEVAGAGVASEGSTGVADRGTEA